MSIYLTRRDKNLAYWAVQAHSQAYPLISAVSWWHPTTGLRHSATKFCASSNLPDK